MAPVRMGEGAWAGGWAAFRALFVLSALLTHAPRIRGIPDAYGAEDLRLAGRLMLDDTVYLTQTGALLAWALGLLGLALLAWGGRAAKGGVLVFLVGFWGLLAAEGGINVKAYDTLLTWLALALLLGPTGERHLDRKWRDASGRISLLLTFSFLYAMTGLAKLTLATEAWWTGSALANILVDIHFGGRLLGAWISDKMWLVRPLAWGTLLFEVSFPLLVWWRRTNPWILLVGVGFHLGTVLTLQVGTFAWVSLAAYPALLHPEVAHALWRRWQAFRGAP